MSDDCRDNTNAQEQHGLILAGWGELQRQPVCDGVLATIGEYARCFLGLGLPPVHTVLLGKLWHLSNFCGKPNEVNDSVVRLIGLSDCDSFEPLVTFIRDSRILDFAELSMPKHREGRKRRRRKEPTVDDQNKLRTRKAHWFTIEIYPDRLFSANNHSPQLMLPNFDPHCPAPPTEFGGLPLARILDPDAVLMQEDHILSMAEKRVYQALFWEPNWRENSVLFYVSKLAKLFRVHRTNVVVPLDGLVAEQWIELDKSLSQDLWRATFIRCPFTEGRLRQWQALQSADPAAVLPFLPWVFRFMAAARPLAPYAAGARAQTPAAARPLAPYAAGARAETSTAAPPLAPYAAGARAQTPAAAPPLAPYAAGARAQTPAAAPPLDCEAAEIAAQRAELKRLRDADAAKAQEQAAAAQDVRKDVLRRQDVGLPFSSLSPPSSSSLKDGERGDSEDSKTQDDEDDAPGEEETAWDVLQKKEGQICSPLGMEVLRAEYKLIEEIGPDRCEGIVNHILWSIAAMRVGVPLPWRRGSGSIFFDDEQRKQLKRIIETARTKPVKAEWTPGTTKANHAKRYLIDAFKGLIADTLSPCDPMRAEEIEGKGDFWRDVKQKKARAAEIGYPLDPWDFKYSQKGHPASEMTLLFDLSDSRSVKRFDRLRTKGG